MTGEVLAYGKTQVIICKDAKDLGARAAADVGSTMKELLRQREEIRMIFAAGESQMTFLDSLAGQADIEWNRVVCFNMDDFWDTRIPEEFTCGYQTRVQLYDRVHPKSFHLVGYNASDPQQEAHRFELLLRAAGPIDILCQGIGTSGHLALNEPFQTDFQDSAWVRVVDVAEQSKRQLSEDPNFKDLGFIPDRGITMTLPAMLSAANVYTVVPLALKRPILTRVLSTPSPTVALPASILSTIPGNLYVDRDSCPTDFISR
jgi:glucosamine-6-phosphate deaminase